MTWIIATKDPSRADDPNVKGLFEDAWAAAPPGFLDEDVIEILPRRRVVGCCRLCGKETTLTKEHIPPKSSGNLQTSRSHSFDDWMQRREIDDLPGGEHQQGGIFGFTLCGACNSYTGTHYGTEYQRWAEIARATLDELPHPLALDELADPLGWSFVAGSEDDGGVNPGAFARQVLSCLCSLSGSWDLAERHPEIRRIVLEQSLEPIPDALALGFGLYFGPTSRMVGPTVMVEPERGEWRWLMELAFPPFTFLCVIASNVKDPGIGLMMNEWTSLDLTERKRLEGIVRIGFGWAPYPGDYRTRAEILVER